MLAIVSVVQFLAHPIGLLRSMFIRNVVADVIAILKHPQFRHAACLRCYALPLFRWYKSVATAHDDQQRACYLLRHTLQVEVLQLVESILLVSSFEAVDVRFPAYHGPLIEAISRAV